jgi:hypothetical protein
MWHDFDFAAARLIVKDRIAAAVIAQPSQLPVTESLPRFMSVWLSAAVAPPVIVVALIDVMRMFASKYAFLSWFDFKYPVVAFGTLLVFSGVAAVGQWWALRRRILDPGLWVMMTFVGVSIGTLAPSFAPLVTVRGAALLTAWINILGHGLLLGLICGGMQALVVPIGWRHQILWFTVSVIFGGLASIAAALARIAVLLSVPLGFFFDMLHRFTDDVVSVFGWTVYLLMIGIGIHWLFVRSVHPSGDSLAARFD